MRQSDAPLLEIRGLTKSFAGVRVLSEVDLAVRAGEVHALIGQNGSGKSTLIKILSGYHSPDAGAIVMRGEPVALPIKPGASARLGLRFLHQDVGVVRSLTVLENLRVGRYQATRFGGLDWREERRAALKILGLVGLDLDPDTVVREVPPAERALIGFARAMQDMDHDRGEILVLDEPTAFLPAPSVEKIFAAVRDMARADPRSSSSVTGSTRSRAFPTACPSCATGGASRPQAPRARASASSSPICSDASWTSSIRSGREWASCFRSEV